MKNNKIPTLAGEPLKYPDHRRPVTRRELLAQGFIGYSAMLTMPSVFSMLCSEIAQAADCGTSTTNTSLPLLVFDMAGGSAMPGNFLVGKNFDPRNSMLNSYDALGWNPKAQGALDESFGLPMAAQVSKMRQGIYETASAEARANLRMGSFAHFSQDDTSSNPSSALTLACKAGNIGSVVSKGLGTFNTKSGGNSDVPLKDATFKPLFMSKVDDLLNSAGFGPTYADISIDARKALGKGITKVSAENLKQYANILEGDKLAKAAECAYAPVAGYANGVSGMDPRADTLFQTLYGITATTTATTPAAISATVVMNALKGNTGPGCITLGGCDYHTGSSTLGDQKDLEIGREIGRAVEASYKLGKPLFFQFITDGGTYAATGTRNWTGDAGDKSLTVIGYYNPLKAPTYRTSGTSPKYQIGRYTDGQGADRSTLIGANVAKVAYAVFANYLYLMVGADKFAAQFALIAPGIFSSTELDSVLIFA